MKRRVYLKGAKLEAFKADLRPALDMQPKSHARGTLIASVSKKYNVSTSKAWACLGSMRRSPQVKRVVPRKPFSNPMADTVMIFSVNDAKVTIEGKSAEVRRLARTIIG